jgi:hypothetical protein
MRPSWAALAGLAVTLAVLLGASAALGVGPLAASVPPDRVTEPREILARSLQATIDASSVHLAGSVSGHVPGTLLARRDGTVTLDGTTLEADIRPHDGRTRARVVSPGLGADLEAVTAWDDAWYRTTRDGAWERASLGDASSDAGIDINPLTLVNRLRAWLATPGIAPVSRDVSCAGASGRCHEVTVDAGSDPARVLALLLRVERATEVPRVTTTVVLLTDAQSLRPVRLLLVASSDDGAVEVRFDVAASRWDEDLVIDVPTEAPTGEPAASPR